jgi:crotonobetainyl-CoA:carnitine CoA-transferase CaiB-like acyl-CoA transferase
VFRTADRPLNIAAGKDDQFKSLLNVLGLPELFADEKFSRPQLRVKNKQALVQALEERLITRGADHWNAELSAVNVPCGPINNIAQTFAEPQVEALGIVQKVEHASLGEVSLARGPLWIDGRPTPIERAAPLLGQHTREVLGECGYPDAAVETLIAKGCVSAAGEVRAT